MAGGKDWGRQAGAGPRRVRGAGGAGLGAAAARVPRAVRRRGHPRRGLRHRGGAARAEAREPLRPDGALPGGQPRQEERDGPCRAGPTWYFSTAAPLLDYWAEGDETLGHLVTHVLVHEIGHHFGLSDADMAHIEDIASAIEKSHPHRFAAAISAVAVAIPERTGQGGRQIFRDGSRGDSALEGHNIIAGDRLGWGRGRALALAAVAALPCADAEAGPTPEEYVAHVGGDAKLVGAGELKLDGRKVRVRPAADGARQQPRRLRRRLSGLPDPQPEAAGPGLHARQAVDPRARVRPPVPRARRGDRPTASPCSAAGGRAG